MENERLKKDYFHFMPNFIDEKENTRWLPWWEETACDVHLILFGVLALQGVCVLLFPTMGTYKEK